MELIQFVTLNKLLVSSYRFFLTKLRELVLYLLLLSVVSICNITIAETLFSSSCFLPLKQKMLQILEMRMMEILKILLGINLIFISVTFAANKWDEPLNNQFKTIKPIAYNVTLIIYRNQSDYKNEYIYEMVFHRLNIYKLFEKIIYKRLEENNFIFYGESAIFFEDIHETRVLRLHASELVIDIMATRIRYFANKTYHEIAPKKHNVHKKEQTIDIIFDYCFLRGINTYQVTIKFIGNVTNNKGGLVRTSYINDKGKKS